MYNTPSTADIVRSDTFWRDGEEEVIAKDAVGFLTMDNHIFFVQFTEQRSLILKASHDMGDSFHTVEFPGSLDEYVINSPHYFFFTYCSAIVFWMPLRDLLSLPSLMERPLIGLMCTPVTASTLSSPLNLSMFNVLEDIAISRVSEASREFILPISSTALTPKLTLVPSLT